MTKQIEEYVKEYLDGQARQNALDFIAFLRSSGFDFYKDNGGYWKDKVYFWVKLGEECLCFIAIKDPEEPENLWTVWSDDSSAYEADIPEEDIKRTAFEHVDFCVHCCSCSDARLKIVFGREFDNVCFCTFRVDNPDTQDLIFLKKMIELRRSACQ